MVPIYVITPGGIGPVWGIDRDKVIVELDYEYLVSYNVDQVEGLE